MSEIIPAILPESFEDLEEKLGMVAGLVPLVHIDVTNSTVTPDSSWPYKGEISHFLRITEEAEGFPYWEDMRFEVHCMVKEPGEIVEDWIKAGAERIIVHLEVFETDELSRFLSLLKNRFDGKNSYLGVEVGLAVNLDTPIEALLPHVLEADFIHMMSIKEIGLQGNPFDQEIFERIKALRSVYPETIISVDGGVTADHLDELNEAGVDRMVIGSAIFGQEDPEVALSDILSHNNS
jgi:ribulose-phosphate 3-epimerase